MAMSRDRCRTTRRPAPRPSRPVRATARQARASDQRLSIARDVMDNIEGHDDAAILWASIVLSFLSHGDEAHRALDMQKLIAGEHASILPRAPAGLVDLAGTRAPNGARTGLSA